MSNSEYSVEFNGSDYLIVYGDQVVGAFSNTKAAYETKRSLEGRPRLSAIDKTPPAMRAAKHRLGIEVG